MTTKQSALFLDRDGVIIENRAHYVRRWQDVEFLPGALDALAQIAHHPFKIIVVTNQSAVGRGIISLETATAINDRIINIVRQHGGRIDAAYICPHAPADRCHCRKPAPGMLLQAAADHDIDLTRATMIGDALTDLQAGRAAGAQAVLLRSGRGHAQIALPAAEALRPFPLFDDLAQALASIVASA